jgi:amino acid permease
MAMRTHTIMNTIGDKTSGVVISLGLLVSGGWWAVNTYMRDGIGDKAKKQSNIAKYVMYLFMILFIMKIAFGTRIAEQARKKAEMGAKVAAQRAARLKDTLNSSAAMKVFGNRKFISRKPVVGLALAMAIGLSLQFKTRNSDDNKTKLKLQAVFLVSLLVFLFVGQVVKDSAGIALQEASAAAASVSKPPTVTSKSP